MQWRSFCRHVEHLSKKDQTRLKEAFDLGEKSHEGQKRLSGDPYFIHPVSTAEKLAAMGADADTLVAALLHDTVEDTSLTLKEIDKQFNGKVASLIDGVTKLVHRDVQSKPTLDEKIETLRKIFTTMQDDVRIMVIKLADRLHNMETIEFRSPEKQLVYARETHDTYVKISERFCMIDMADELEELCMSVLDPKLLQRLKTLRASNEKLGEQYLIEMKACLHKVDPSLETSVQFTHKPWRKLKVQLQSGGGVVTGVSALTAIVLCKDTPSCYTALGDLHKCWRREQLSFQDYINSPLSNGYQGLHTTVILTDGTRVRCKIRTHDMQEYAHRGISMRCFDSEAMGILDYLPWTERITPLTEDTTDRSQAFWESLQSDILGESIIIHGTDDQAVLLPQDATVLDGAFFCYGARALTLTAARVNGKEAILSDPLENGVSLEIDTNSSETVTWDWLKWTRTGLATAHIRTALAAKSPTKKAILGKQILQNIFDLNHRGFISEFDTKHLQARLHKLGYRSLAEAYRAIADGSVQPEVLYRSLFDSKRDVEQQMKHARCVLRFSAKEDADHILQTLLQTMELKNIEITDLRVKKDSDARINVRLRGTMTHVQQQSIRQQLELLGVPSFSIRKAAEEHIVMLFVPIMLLLWGLDPVAAHMLLKQPISAFDLTFIRLITVFGASALVFVVYSTAMKNKLKPLSPFNPLLIGSGLLLALTALSSYLALSILNPNHYILFIIGGVLMGMFIKEYARRTTQWLRSLMLLLFTIATLVLLLFIEDISVIGIPFAIAATTGFALYSYLSEHYQQGVIHARYPAFLFWLTVFGLPLALILIPFTHLYLIPPQVLFTAIVYTLVFSLIPYALYFESMRRTHLHSLDAMLPLAVGATMIGEICCLRSFNSLAALPLLCIYIWHLFQTKHQK